MDMSAVALVYNFTNMSNQPVSPNGERVGAKNLSQSKVIALGHSPGSSSAGRLKSPPTQNKRRVGAASAASVADDAAESQ